MTRILLFTGAALFAAISHCAQFSPELAAAVVATCDLTKLPIEQSDIYCLHQDSSTKLCFSTDNDRGLYMSYQDRLASARRTGYPESRVPSAEPVAICSTIDGKNLPSELHCFSTEQSSDLTCFSTQTPIYCSSPRLGSDTIACFAHRAELTEYYIQRRRKELSGWEAFLAENSERLSMCTQSCEEKPEGFESVVCPQISELWDEKEPLHDYVARIISGMATDKQDTRERLHAEDFLSARGQFWTVPWSMRRYLLATMIELDMIKPNETLSVSGLTPLDHATQYNDEEMIFFLWSKGARHASDKDTLGLIKEIMMKTSDERSFAILDEIDRERLIAIEKEIYCGICG